MTRTTKPEWVTDAEWRQLCDAVLGRNVERDYFPDPMPRAHINMWQHGGWSFERAMLQLALAQSKRVAEYLKRLTDREWLRPIEMPPIKVDPAVLLHVTQLSKLERLYRAGWHVHPPEEGAPAWSLESPNDSIPWAFGKTLADTIAAAPEPT